MAVGCPANDPITQAEAQCFLEKNPGMLDFYRNNGWSTETSNYIAIACDARFGAGVSDPRYANKTFGAYLIGIGCRAAPTNPSPGPTPTPPTVPGSGTDYVGQVRNWVSTHPLPAVLIAAGAAWVVFGGRR